jgi:hypothetical protein
MNAVSATATEKRMTLLLVDGRRILHLVGECENA